MEYDTANHFLSIVEGGRARVVYSSALLRVPSSQTSVARSEWDAKNGSLTVPLPSTPESYPLVIAFSVSGKKLEGPSTLTTLFPSLKFGPKGEVIEGGSSSSASSDEERKVPAEISVGGESVKKIPKAAVSKDAQVVPGSSSKKRRSFNKDNDDKSSSEDELAKNRAEARRGLPVEVEVGSSSSESDSSDDDESVKRRKVMTIALIIKNVLTNDLVWSAISVPQVSLLQVWKIMDNCTLRP